jgi:hypothetical protein
MIHKAKRVSRGIRTQAYMCSYTPKKGTPVLAQRSANHNAPAVRATILTKKMQSHTRYMDTDAWTKHTLVNPASWSTLVNHASSACQRRSSTASDPTAEALHEGRHRCKASIYTQIMLVSPLQAPMQLSLAMLC